MSLTTDKGKLCVRFAHEHKPHPIVGLRTLGLLLGGLGMSHNSTLSVMQFFFVWNKPPTPNLWGLSKGGHFQMGGAQKASVGRLFAQPPNPLVLLRRVVSFVLPCKKLPCRFSLRSFL